MKKKIINLEACSPAILKYLVILVVLLSCLSVKSQPLSNQISAIEEKVFTDRTEALIKDYFGNLTTIGKLDEEQDIFIGGIVKTDFENEKVRVWNDLDPTNSTQSDFDASAYLSNISLFFSNSDVDFEIQKLNLSKIYYSAESGNSPAFFFIKGEVLRKMVVSFNEKEKTDSTLLDLYIKFIPYKSNPRIYSIKKHESNLDRFKLVTVIAAESNESLQNDNVIFESKPVPEIKPGQFYLNSVPEGASVDFVDYPDFGKKITPATITFPVTKYSIKLVKDEYEVLDTVINIGVDKTKSFALTPKFSFLNFNVKPENADVLVNKEPMYFSNGINQKTGKGNKSIVISAAHYYSQEQEINAYAGKVQNVNVTLAPVNGTLSIAAKNLDANQAIVYLDNIKIGTIPLTKYTIQEGKHAIKIEKTNFSSVIKLIDISENTETKIDFALFSRVKVGITTEPSGAEISIDNKPIGNSNLSTKLSVGSHQIKIVKDNYQTIDEPLIILENAPTNKYAYSLTKLTYSVSVNTKPSKAEIYLDGTYKGESPLNFDVLYGTHRLKFIHPNSLSKSKSIAVSEPYTSNTKLFPKDYVFFGADFGLDQIRANAGFVAGGFLMSAGLQMNLNTNKSIKSNGVKINNVTAYDKYLYKEEDGRIYNADSVNLSFNGKIGFTIKKPFVFLVTAGCSFIKTDQFQKVYKAKHSYIGENSGTIVRTGELFSEPINSTYVYTAITAGLMLPIAQTFYFSADYFSDSDIGPGYSFGLGFFIK